MLEHLVELRRRTIRIVSAFLIIFLIFFLNANTIFHFVVSPLLNALPTGSVLIATQVAAPLITPIQLAFDMALLFTCPYAIHQLWLFTAPGLYKCERDRLKGMVIMSLFLFCLGLAFCFYIVLPFILNFFTRTVPDGVHYMPDMTSAVRFITRMLLIFGLCFQVPVISLLLNHLGWVTKDTLKIYRPYVIVSAFILGMLLTPPDVLSQILLAVPLCGLYELGILFVMWFGEKEIKELRI